MEHFLLRVFWRKAMQLCKMDSGVAINSQTFIGPIDEDIVRISIY